MVSRRSLRRLERAAADRLDVFEIRDGSWHVFDFDRDASALFVYCVQAFGLEEPDVPEPEIFCAIRKARDPEAAIQRFLPQDPSKQFVDVSVLLRETSGD